LPAARLAEIRELLAAYDRGELGDGGLAGTVDTVTGYRAWSATYDEPGNPLIEVRRRLARMPASRFLPSDYLSAALPLGFQVHRCMEPRWPPSPWAGGPEVRRWCAAAADAEHTPAAIIWHFQKST
jgi:hypothetical protein